MNRASSVRRRTRFPVRWPVVYRCGEFLGEGTVLDFTHRGWRVAGCMPVKPDMRLILRMWPPDKPEHVRIKRTTVLWAKDCEFAVDVPEMEPNDHAWFNEFLDQKQGLSWLPRAAVHRPHHIDCLSATEAEPSAA